MKSERNWIAYISTLFFFTSIFPFLQMKLEVGAVWKRFNSYVAQLTFFFTESKNFEIHSHTVFLFYKFFPWTFYCYFIFGMLWNVAESHFTLSL